MNTKTFDFVVIGAGIVGLTIARALARAKAGRRILVIEKESSFGNHASGRNSGVVHAGIYYAADSLKARFCVEGSQKLIAYAEENKIPLLKCGKVIVAPTEAQVPTLQTLLERARLNGVPVERVDLCQLRELEPLAHSHEWALWSPRTSVIDSKATLTALTHELQSLGVEFALNTEVSAVNLGATSLKTSSGPISYGTVINCAGAYADRIAHLFGVGTKYRILPFKGLYWRSSSALAKKVQRLIYPAPDVRMPFLGVHVTRTVSGEVLFGPTATPALGRENYALISDIDWREAPAISWSLVKTLVQNPDGFRNYALHEIKRYFSSSFFREAKALIPELQPSDIAEFYKVGIRAQLLNTESGRLEMDFVMDHGPNSLHILNAVSPAFTSAFAFADYVTQILVPPEKEAHVFQKFIG